MVAERLAPFSSASRAENPAPPCPSTQSVSWRVAPPSGRSWKKADDLSSLFFVWVCVHCARSSRGNPSTVPEPTPPAQALGSFVCMYVCVSLSVLVLGARGRRLTPPEISNGPKHGCTCLFSDHDAALALQLSREWSDDPTNAPPPPVRPAGIPTPYGGGGGARGGSSDRRGRRVALPEYFLRTPGWGGQSDSSSDPQVAADAKLAMMLQNEAFQRELQAHPELAHLGRDPRRGDARGNLFGGGGGDGPSIKEQMTSMGNDIRRKVDELAVRWKMKDPGRADETTEYSAVPLLDSNRDDQDDEAEVVHFSQNSATRRTSSGGASAAAGGMGVFRADSAGEEQLGERERGDRQRHEREERR
ncbi:unnamed protein product [Scytosiphon promiscuus]